VLNKWQAATEKDGSVNEYAIVRQKQSIAKVYVMGCKRYELWHNARYIGYFEDVCQAKAKADALIVGK
jgi:hypothetical protein